MTDQFEQKALEIADNLSMCVMNNRSNELICTFALAIREEVLRGKVLVGQEYVDAVNNLIAVKGRFHTEQAMNRLIAAITKAEQGETP